VIALIFLVNSIFSAKKQELNKNTGHHYDWEISFGKIDHDLCERNFNMTTLYLSTLHLPIFYMDWFDFGDYSVNISSNGVTIDTG
jgi:hypothetical protein